MKFKLLIILACFPIILYSQKVKLKQIQFINSEVIKEEYYVLKKNKKLKHGDYKSYFKNGQLKENGIFLNNVKDGEWKIYNSGRELKIRMYKKGRKISEKKVGLWKKAEYENGQVIIKCDYDNNKSLDTLIRVNIKYPIIARENGVEGTVKFKVKINENCEFEELTTIKAIGAGCEEEVIKSLKKVLQLIKKYNPKQCTEIGKVLNLTENIYSTHFKLH